MRIGTTTTPARHSRRRGAAMVLVLIIMATATITGLAYLSRATIATAATEGHADAARARQLAESGVQHAICLMRENPALLVDSSQTPLGPFPVDDSGDSYTISVAPDAVIGMFEITCRGVSGRSVQTARALVRHSGGVFYRSVHAMLSGGPFCLAPWSLAVAGDMHVNGNAFVLGRVDGDVYATGSIFGYGEITGEQRSNAAPVALPMFDPADYKRYVYGETPGEAIRLTTNLITSGHPIDWGRAVTAFNPAGVVVARPTNGSLWLWEDLRFTGTLVVHGDLVLDGWNMRLSAKEGFPAAVVTGRLFITNYARDVRVDGLVYAAGGVYPYNSTYNSETTFRGGLICGVNGFSSSCEGDHEVKLNSQWTSILDPQGWGVGGTVELLEWRP